MPKSETNPSLRFDWTGFGVLALGIGALQMMLDRGQDKDWFSSGEIITEAVLAGLGLYLFIVHLLTAEKPFITPRIFRDPNFAASLAMMFAVGVVLLATSALLAPWLQTLGGYPVATAGLVMAPRGVGTMACMFIAGRLTTRVDPRKLMGFGLLLLIWSLYESTTWTPDLDPRSLIAVLMVQGAALGFVFIPLQVVAFATLDAPLRTEGTALLNLFRNVGSAIGISVTSALLARNTQVMHSELGAFINPFNRALQTGGPVSHLLNPSHTTGAELLNALINYQAQIIAYVDDYKFMMLTTLPALLLLFFMRRPGTPAAKEEGHAAVLD